MNLKSFAGLGLTLVLLSSVLAAPLGTTFTYQGRLNDGTNPANGTYNFQFALYDSLSAGTQIGPTLTNAVTVTEGTFSARLDFGVGVFDGNARWLQIAVRTNGSGIFTPLDPRQPLSPSPYALYALTPAGPQGPQGIPGAQGLQGLRGLTWRGTWSGSSNYLADDAVQSNGSAWLARRANQNVTPAEGADWSLLAQKGDNGKAISYTLGQWEKLIRYVLHADLTPDNNAALCSGIRNPQDSSKLSGSKEMLRRVA
jgi:hypothetical protein